MMMAAASRARGKTILVIDDDPDIVRIIRYMLRDAGCQVSYAYNGADGIQKAKAEKPDLVLTDLSMPNVSGIEVIDALHNDPETQHIPILAVTGHAWDTIAQVAHQFGCMGCVSKPFTREQLLQQVRRSLDPASRQAPAAPPVAAPSTEVLRLRTD